MCEYNQFGQALGVALPDWQPRPWPTRQVLQGSRCRLEPLTLA
ncbi:GNAT family N-acetyltransferase, partial [Escherichia coli]